VIKKIVVYPDPILREVMPAVEWSDDLEECLQDMYDSLASEKNGIALAANQLGIRKHFFVVRQDLADANFLPSLIINPRVVRSGNILSVEEEGCLSFPGVRRSVKRPKKVDVEFDFLPLQKKKVTLTGLVSRVFQHEIAHLNGHLFIDEPPE
jgi:peptide deformylase